MIDPATSWFEIVKLLVTDNHVIPMDTKRRKGKRTHTTIKEPYFDKSSAMISTSVNKSCVGINVLYKTMEVNSNFTLQPSVMHMA